MMSSRAAHLRRRWASRRAMSDSWPEVQLPQGSAATTETYLPSFSTACPEWPSQDEGPASGAPSGAPSGAGTPSGAGSPVVWEGGGPLAGAWCGCAGAGQPSCSSPLHESVVGGLTGRVCCLLEPWHVDVAVQTDIIDEGHAALHKPRKFLERQRSGHGGERIGVEHSLEQGHDPPGGTCGRSAAPATGFVEPVDGGCGGWRRGRGVIQRPRSRSYCAPVETTAGGEAWPRKLMCPPEVMEFSSQTSPGSLGGSPPRRDVPTDSESFDQDELTSHLQELPSQMPRRESRTGLFNGLYTSLSAATKLRLVHQLSVDETRSTVYADLAALAAAPDLTGVPPLPYTADLTPLKPAEKRRRFFQRKQTNSAPDSFDGNLPGLRGPAVSYCLDSALKVPTLLPWSNAGQSPPEPCNLAPSSFHPRAFILPPTASSLTIPPFLHHASCTTLSATHFLHR